MRYLRVFSWICMLLVFTLDVKADDPRTWQFKTPMPTARSGVSAVEVDGLVYVMGGVDAEGNVLNIVEIYDPAIDSWQSGPNLRDSVFNAAAIYFEGRIFLIGGQDSMGNSSKKVNVLDPATNDWDSFDNLRDDREGLAAVVLHDELYVMGGSNSSANILDSVEFLDGDKWEDSDDWELDVPRALFAYVTYNDFVYSIGGFSTFGTIGLVQRYNDTDGTLDMAPLMPGRGGLSAALLDSSIYVMGGRRSNNQVVNTVDRFFPDENRWESAAAMNTARERFATVSVNDQIYVFGGNTGNGEILNSVEVFTMSIAPQPANDVLITDEEVSMSINVLVNDVDPSGGSLTISSFSQPAHGAVSQESANTFSYTPVKDFAGTDQFTYTVINQTGGTAQAVVNVTVQNVNDPPAFTSTPVTGAAQHTAYAYTVTANDIENDNLVFEALALPDWLSLLDMQDGTAILNGMPGEDDLGTFTVSLEVSDGVDTGTQEFEITVVEGAPTEIMLIFPADGAQGLGDSVVLTWRVEGAVSYDLEVALDESFTNVILEVTGIETPTYTLENLEANTAYFWRVRGTNAAGTNVWSPPATFQTALDIANEDELPERVFELYPTYPNPFSTSTWIEFELREASVAQVELTVYDIRGKVISRLESGYLGQGTHRLQWDGRDDAGIPVASGTYLVRLHQGAAQQTRTVMLVR